MRVAWLGLGLLTVGCAKSRPPKVPVEGAPQIHMAMILAESVQLPTPEAFQAANERLGGPALTFAFLDDDGTLVWSMGEDGAVMMMPVDAPNPNAAEMCNLITSPAKEAAAAAPSQVALMMLGVDGKVAHMDSMMVHMTAALCAEMPCVGTMLSHGMGYHKPEVFTSLAEDLDLDEAPVVASIDITISTEEDGRLSMLTHGMPRYGREDFYVIGPQRTAEDSYELIRMMSTWLATTDKVLPTGETVGRSEEEKILIQRVDSPIYRKSTVILLER